MDLSNYNVVWNEQSKNSGESMPCGGYDTGMNVWVENGQLLMYVDRSGSFDENNQMLKLGRFRFVFSEDVFKNHFKQRLCLEEGNIHIEGDCVRIVIWSDVTKAACHVEIESERPIEITAQYESWRTKDRELKYGGLCSGERMAAASYCCYPNKVYTWKDQVITKDDKVIFYHQNRNDKLLFDFLVEHEGLGHIKEKLYNPQKDFIFGGVFTGDGCCFTEIKDGTYAGIPFTAYALKSERKKNHTFIIGLSSNYERDNEKYELTLLEYLKEIQNDKYAKDNAKKWWREYWKRSHVLINYEKNRNDEGFQVGRNYMLFRYMLGCNAYGSYPTKFNGGLFTTDAVYSVGKSHTFLNDGDSEGKTPDFRAWGGGSFTAQNQRLVYWPMLKNGDFDMMKSQFDFYARLLNNAEVRTREYWEHDGCSFTEQLENIGLPLAWSWGFEDTEDYNWRRPKNFDPTEMRCSAIRYLYSTQLEFAYMIIVYHQYTGLDISEYIPFIESCVTFYFEHYKSIHKCNACSEYDENGKLVIFPSTALETYKDALNPTDAIAGLNALILALMNMDEYVDSEKYRQLYQHLPEIKIDKIHGKNAILPAYSWTHVHNVELPQLYPVFPYGLYGLGKDGLEIAIHTWNTAPEKQKDYISWHQDGIFTARLGLNKEAKNINTQKMKDSGRKFPAFWGPGHDWVPDHNWGGSGMIGIQEMLVQCYEEKIYLFGAWDKEWDVSFKLHASMNTVIECVLEKGEIKKLKIEPKERQKDVIVCI